MKESLMVWMIILILVGYWIISCHFYSIQGMDIANKWTPLRGLSVREFSDDFFSVTYVETRRGFF